MLLLYAYCVGIPSSRRIERVCWDDAAFRVLAGNQQPDHQIIVAVGVSNQASDAPHHEPMIERIVANTGHLPEMLIAVAKGCETVAGYCSTGNIETREQRELDA
jgi:hypothetical protein